MIREVSDHWYLYGLTITEHRLWSAFFREVEGRIGRALSRDDVRRRPEAAVWFRALAALKLAWPFRRADAPGPCNFFFDDERYTRLDVERRDPSIPVSPYEVIFRELESRFEDTGVLRRAEAVVERYFENLAAVLVN